MADVKVSRSILARATALGAWVLASLSASVIPAEEHTVAPPYYLTITLVKSHLPEAVMKGNIKERLFGDMYKTATLQIELNIGAEGKYPYSSTTIARVIERQTTNWLGLSRRKKDTYIDSDRRDYVVVKDRRILQDDLEVNVVYSATLHNMDTVTEFLNSVEGTLQVADFTYSGLASQILRMFTRSSENQFSATETLLARNIPDRNCVILQPQSPKERKESRQCEDIEDEPDFPYIELKLDVSHTHFPRGRNTIQLALDNYIDENHGERSKRLYGLRSQKGERLDDECRKFRDELDVDLVPEDRNLVLIRQLQRMNYDPYWESPIACWTDNKLALEALIDKNGRDNENNSLALGGCAQNPDETRKECELVGAFNEGWRNVSDYEQSEFDWIIEAEKNPAPDEGRGNLRALREKYMLDLLYGGFNRIYDTWKGAGVIHDRGAGCRFPATIEVSVVEGVVYSLKVTYRKNASARGVDVGNSIDSARRCRDED